MSIIKGFIVSLLVTFSLCAFAGSEDWYGKFYLVNAAGETNTVIHNPNSIEILSSMRVGRRFSFSKGSNFNNFIASENGSLEITMNIEKFTQEVSKLGGTITDKEIIPGRTYS